MVTGRPSDVPVRYVGEFQCSVTKGIDKSQYLFTVQSPASEGESQITEYKKKKGKRQRGDLNVFTSTSKKRRMKVR